MKEPKWILSEAVAAIHRMLLAEHGGGEGVRDTKLLDSALNRAKQKFSYEDNCTIFDLAAAYSFGIAKNHPFVDGNKRTAFTIGVIFIELNAFHFRASEAESTVMFESLASGKISEPELAEWFKKNSEEA